MSGSNPNPANDILLDGMHFQVIPDSKANVSAVDRFPGKVTVGDYSLDSNDLLSAWVIADLTGGHGVFDLKEGVDDNRYWFGTLYTRRPNQITKPYGIFRNDIGSGAVFPLGDMYDYAGSEFDFYAASGTDLFRNLVDTTSNLTGVPASKGVAFRGAGSDTFFYIPMGNNGYAVYEPDGPTFANINAGGDADNFQAFCLWDNKLIGITNGGQLYYATTAANPTVFTSYGSDGKLDRSIEPKALHVYYSKTGDPAVHVVTDSGVWVFDAATPRLYQIPDFNSEHPYMGIASAVWRGNLYVAAGLDLLEYNGNVVRNVGLSRDFGLPYAYSGFIRDLASGQDGLYALVRGDTISGDSITSVHEWSGFGWCCVWASTATNLASRMSVSRADDKYRLYWGLTSGGDLYYQNLPKNTISPRSNVVGAIAATYFGDFTTDTSSGAGNTSTRTYFLETGWFDGNMPGYRKIANATEVMFDANSGGDEDFKLYYQVDDDTSWTEIATSTNVGGGVLLYQFGTYDSANALYPGLGFERIRFRIEVIDDIPDPYVQSATTIINALVFSYLKLQNPSLSYVLQVDLTAEYQNQSPENMYDKLASLRSAERFYALKHQDKTYRVRIAGFSGGEETGYTDKRGVYTLSILEIPSRLGLAS